MKVIVQVPVYNEEKRLGATLDRIHDACKALDVEIVVIDDGCYDDSVAVARKHRAQVILTHTYNKWVWWAFATWVNYFFWSDADILVNIDADGQFDPYDIPKLIQPLVEWSTDIALANRFGAIKPVNMPYYKYRMNIIIASTIWMFMNYDIQDLTCGFRWYTREALYQISLQSSFTYTQESIIDAISKWIKLEFIPVCVTYYTDRKSRVVSSFMEYVSKSVMIIMRTVRDARPLMFFGIPGLVLFFLGLFALIYFTSSYLITSQTSPYRTWLYLWWILTIIGLLVVIFALIADMIKRQRKATDDTMYLLRKSYYEK